LLSNRYCYLFLTQSMDEKPISVCVDIASPVANSSKNNKSSQPRTSPEVELASVPKPAAMPPAELADGSTTAAAYPCAAVPFAAVPESPSGSLT
jgi:hypothetical protein